MATVAKNTKHFAAGSSFPPLQEGVLRIYSMFFCPYAQRTRIILQAKNVKHETININLKKKPDWFLALNPLAKVPTLQQNDKIMYESMITCDYLEEIYPDPPLYPSDPWAKAVDRCFIEVFGSKVGSFYHKILFGNQNDEASRNALLQNLYEGIDIFEAELKKRGTKFFFGDRPGMLDYAMFPWLERIAPIEKIFPGLSMLPKDRFPRLSTYLVDMLEDPAAQYTVTKDMLQYLESVVANNVNYDIGVE